jgi:hypothetical protein
MHKPLFRIAVGSVAAVGGLIAASALPAGAATAGRAETMAQTVACTPPTLGACADTPVTFSITTTGTLAITAPTTPQVLGTTAQNLTTGPTIGAAGASNFTAVTVTDSRDEAASTWTATVSTTAFTTPGVTGNVIPADDASYVTNGVSASTGGFAAGDIADDTSTVKTAGAPYIAAPIGLTSTPTDIVTESGFDGDNAATWTPTIIIAVPITALVGVYTGTVTHSVS